MFISIPFLKMVNARSCPSVGSCRLGSGLWIILPNLIISYHGCGELSSVIFDLWQSISPRWLLACNARLGANVPLGGGLGGCLAGAKTDCGRELSVLTRGYMAGFV